MSEAKNKHTAGYKTVQLGPKSVQIPDDWSVTKLSDISKVNYGKSLPDSTGDIPAIGSSGIYNRVGDSLIKENTIVVGRKGSAGEAYLLQQPCWPSDTAFYLSDFNSNEMDMRYLHYYMSLNSLVEELEQTTIPSLDRTRLETYQIITPPLPEQRQIAEILSTVDEQIQQTEEAIQATAELKRGLSQDLYGHNVSDDQFPERASELPPGWSRKQISELCSIGGGSTPSKSNSEYWGGDILWASPKDFNGPVLKETEDKLTELAIQNSSLSLYEQGNIAIVVRSGVLRHTLPVAKITTPTTVNQDVKVLEPNPDEIQPEYFYQILSMQSNRIRQRCMKTGTTVQSIETSFLKKYKIRIPPVEKQQQIAGVLTNLDTKIRLEKEHRDDLKELKRGLMQDLLTGTKRVNTN